MELLQLFKQYLFSQKNTPSKNTVKNYKADIGHFIHWWEQEFGKTFNPWAITPQMIELYKKQTGISPRSLKRHLSSLRKFFYFLKTEGIIRENPLGNHEGSETNKSAQDPYRLKSFKDYLFIYNASKLTIKNYIMDIRQFLSWAEQVIKVKDEFDTKNRNLFDKIDSFLIEEYKKRLLNVKMSPVSINRKLSSIRKYLKWSEEEKLIKFQISNFKYQISNKNIKPLNNDKKTFDNLKTQLANKNKSTDKELEIRNLELEIGNSYSRFPPLRLVQKINKGINSILDIAFVTPLVYIAKQIQYKKWKLQGKPVFYKIKPPSRADKRMNLDVSAIPKSFYAPVSTRYYSWHKKLFHYYKRYQSYSIVQYFHLSILIIFMSALGFGFYTNFIDKPQKKPVVAKVTPKRILSFQGRLTDSFDIPITTQKNVRFAIYNDSSSSGSALLWQEVNSITPDNNGAFFVETAVPQTLFSDNNALFLGISVGTNAEFVPRQQLAIVSLAATAETLQGLSPITRANSGTKNVILALDSSGNLTIDNSSVTVFQVLNGQFKLSGQPLVLTTSAGSNGNIELNPDGFGKIDVQKPLQNTSDNNNISSVIGAVEVNDLFSILATSSAQSALTINQNDIGPIISASASGYARFWVANSGRAYFADNVGIGTQDTSSFKLQIAGSIGPNMDLLYDLGSSSARFKKAYIQELITGESGTFGFWQRDNSGVLSPSNISDSLNVGATSTSSALIHLGGMSGENSFFNNGNFGIGTATPSAKFQVGNQGDGSIARANAWTEFSDIRFKENIANISGALNKVLSLSGVSFNWKSSGLASIGFIAQEVEKIVPEIVSTDSLGYKSLDYGKLTPLLVEAIKEQQQKIASLSSVISSPAKTDEKFPISPKTGEIKIIKLTSENNETFDIYALTDSLGQSITKIGAFAKLASANIKAGAINAIEITTNTMQSKEIISPIAKIDQFQTNLISPLSSASAITIGGKLIVKSSPVIATPDQVRGRNDIILEVQGSASVSGNITADSGEFNNVAMKQLNNEGDATIAGTLRADRIIANTLDTPDTPNLASFSARLAFIENFSSDFARFNQGIISFGPTSLSDVSVTGQLSIGSSFIIAENSINTLGGNLELQPLRQGGISMMGGKVYIDTDGNLKVGENAGFAKNVDIKGVLSTNIIAPVPDSNFVIQNASGSGILTVDQEGNLTASGAANIKDIFAKTFNIVRGAQADTSFTETVASSSAGWATIITGETERTIINPYVSETSLIYITPVTDMQGISPYIARQTPSLQSSSGQAAKMGSFTIQIPQRAIKDITVNWWIVN